MTWRYLISTAVSINPGGTSNLIRGILQGFQQIGIKLAPLDYTSTEIDFEVLLVFSFSYHNPDMLESLAKKGVKIILWPIFDRTKPMWTFGLYRLFEKTPIRTLYGIRRRILQSASLILAGGDSERQDLESCFKISSDRIKIAYLPVNPEFLSTQVGPELFAQKYGLTDFVIYSAAQINSRKNQILLLKALQDTDFKIVLTGCDQVLVPEFSEIVAKNPNVLVLGKIPLPELISAYQNARVSVSLSTSETAGLALLESAYFGCQLVISDIPAFREYLGGPEMSSSVSFLASPLQEKDIRDQITRSFEKPRISQKDYISQNFTYPAYIEKVRNLIEGL